MTQVNRRSALSVGLAAMAAFVAAASAYAQRQLPPGISLQAWGKRESMIPGYKTVSMRDLVYQPGAKTSNPSMPNDMVCHIPEGELRVKQSDGMEFVYGRIPRHAQTDAARRSSYLALKAPQC